MTLVARKHTVAWLGLIAIWLVVLAPLVSQLVAWARSHEPIAITCSAVHGEGTAHHASADPLSACGYCDVFGHHVPAPAVPPAQLVATVVLASTQIVAPPPFTPFAAFPSGRPRDPPL